MLARGCCGPAHHDVVLRPGDGGHHVDTVSGEVPSLLGPVVDAVSPAGVHHVLSVVFVQDDQIPLGEAEECGLYPCFEVKTFILRQVKKKKVYICTIHNVFKYKTSVNLTRVGTVQQSHHVLGPLPQTLEEGDHQVPDVLRVVGGERVLVCFDGGQSETLTLKFTPSARRTFALIRPVCCV